MSAIASQGSLTQPSMFPTMPTAGEQRDFAQKLRSQTLACRLRLEKLGTRKALTTEQRKEAAEPFGADHKSLSASKKILDTRDPAFRAVRSVLSRAKSHWKAMTTPYPEPGIRLIRKASVELFDQFMNQCAIDLDESVKALQAKYPELKDRASVALAQLFDDADYPSRIDTAFGLEWDFPSVEPPAHLKQLHPDLYEAECKKIEARFSVAVEQAEQAFVAQFQHLVSHLVERLKGDGAGGDGKPKVFRDSAVANLNEFFASFRQLDIGSSTKLQQLVAQAEHAVAGITADELRENTDARVTVAASLGQVAEQIDSLMVNKPDRKIELPEEGQ
jgi:hypothetical protein